MGFWDVTFKLLLRLRPQDLLGLVPGIREGERLRLVDKELVPPAAPRTLDGCVELESEGGEGTLYHVEFESTPRSDTALRVFEHFAWAHCANRGREVRPIVYYLEPGKEGREPAECHEAWADGRKVLDFRFETVLLWEIEADELLRRPAPALWSVVALAKSAGLGHVEQARDRIEREVPDEKIRRELYGVLVMVSGTQFDPETVRVLVRKEMYMESATYLEAVREGEKKGIQKGHLEGLREGCQRLARAKLGTLDPLAEERIAGVGDASVLKALLDEIGAAADAATVSAALDRLRK